MTHNYDVNHHPTQDDLTGAEIAFVGDMTRSLKGAIKENLALDSFDFASCNENLLLLTEEKAENPPQEQAEMRAQTDGEQRISGLWELLRDRRVAWDS